MQLQSGSCHGIAGGRWCPGVRVIYGIFGGATVHGDVAYSTQICSLVNTSPRTPQKTLESSTGNSIFLVKEDERGFESHFPN